MTGLTSTELFGLVVVVVLCVVLAAVGLIMLQRLRRRRDQLRGELSHRPEAVSDRAFNRIAMARREADALAGQGIEVPRARELVGEAQAAFDSRQFDRSYELAQSAHETLVAARQRPPRPAAAAPVSSAPLGAQPPPADVPSAPVGGSADAAAPRLPAHRAESQFQLRLLKEELDRIAQRNGGDVGEAARARGLYAQAQAAFDRQEYAEAFRLALKGRREAGSSVETLAPPARGTSSAPAVAPSGSVVPADPEQAADVLAASDRCPECGHPMTADDPFCRGCGIPRPASA